MIKSIMFAIALIVTGVSSARAEEICSWDKESAINTAVVGAAALATVGVVGGIASVAAIPTTAGAAVGWLGAFSLTPGLTAAVASYSAAISGFAGAVLANPARCAKEWLYK